MQKRKGLNLLMTARIIVVMSYQAVGNLFHEAAGILLLILFLIHNALNWKWYKNIGKGKYSRFRILMVTVNLLTLISMLLAMATGIYVSQSLFSSLWGMREAVFSSGHAAARRTHSALPPLPVFSSESTKPHFQNDGFVIQSDRHMNSIFIPTKRGEKAMYQFDRAAYEKRMEWYRDARFGMFIHWGLYAIPARGEWVRSVEEIPKEDYMKYFYEFNPTDYDPKKWAQAAKDAGMKYVVLTAKHHDGFCLFDSQYTDFKSTNTKCGRDLVAEYVEAVREAGLKVGLYFSLIDWYHDDFPHYGDRNHPMRNHPEYSNENRDFDRYLTYMHNQVREICTNYGKIDVLWFDFSYDELRGEAWKGTELIDMVRSLQPDVIIDNRLEVSGEGYGSLATGNPAPYHGDFVSPEQMIPPNGIQDVHGQDIAWEACVTMNNNWGYHATDHYFKPASMLIKKLVECVSKGGNLLLNVGPDAKGNIPEESLERLAVIGRWMKKNGDSIYGCGKAEIEKPDFGRVTAKGKKLYFHMYENTIGPVPLPGLKKEEIASIRWLATGAEIPVSTSWVHSDYPDIVFANLGPDPVLPDEIDTVLEVTLK